MIPYGDYPDLSAIRKVLVIKLRHHGDVLLTSPIFSCLKKMIPGVSVDAFIYSETFPMLAGNPWLDTIHGYDNRWKKLPLGQRIRRELDLVRAIRSSRYDMVINLTEGDRGAIAGMVAGAAVRVGVDPGLDGVLAKKLFYTHIVKRSRNPRHIVEQHLDALRKIGLFPAEEDRNLHLHIPAEDEERVGAFLRQEGIQSGKFIVMHLTSRWLFKCWPLEKNIQLIEALRERGIPIVLSASPDPVELDLIETIVKRCGERGVVSLAGKLSLKELAALIRQSLCLFTIDSVPFHMASSLKKASVALFGPSSELIWGPWRNEKGRVLVSQHSCRPCNLDGCGGGKVSDCMAAISVSQVLEALTDLISSRGTGS